jgi:hypothetical protein
VDRFSIYSFDIVSLIFANTIQLLLKLHKLRPNPFFPTVSKTKRLQASAMSSNNSRNNCKICILRAWRCLANATTFRHNSRRVSSLCCYEIDSKRASMAWAGLHQTSSSARPPSNCVTRPAASTKSVELAVCMCRPTSSITFSPQTLAAARSFQ